MRLQIDKEGVKIHEIKLIKLLYASLFEKLPYLPNRMGQKYNASYAECSTLTMFPALDNALLADSAYWLFLYSLFMLTVFIQSDRILRSEK